MTYANNSQPSNPYFPYKNAEHKKEQEALYRDSTQKRNQEIARTYCFGTFLEECEILQNLDKANPKKYRDFESDYMVDLPDKFAEFISPRQEVIWFDIKYKALRDNPELVNHSAYYPIWEVVASLSEKENDALEKVLRQQVVQSHSTGTLNAVAESVETKEKKSRLCRIEVKKILESSGVFEITKPPKYSQYDYNVYHKSWENPVGLLCFKNSGDRLSRLLTSSPLGRQDIPIVVIYMGDDFKDPTKVKNLKRKIDFRSICWVMSIHEFQEFVNNFLGADTPF